MMRSRAVPVGLVLLTAACGETPRGEVRQDPLSPALPDSVVRFLAPDTVRQELVAPGLSYHYLWAPEGPWAVHVLGVDLSRCELGLDVLPALDRAGAMTRARVSRMFENAGDAALAAVNGDFFTPEGRPVGMEVNRGTPRSRGPRPVLSWRPDRGPWIGSPGNLGDTALSVGWPLSLEVPDGWTEVVAGFPELLDHGQRVRDLEVESRPGFAANRHPRTAVGFSEADSLLWLAVVDGRQEAYSDGMSLPELTSLLEALGVEEALNLDGGGSSVMIVGGRAVSRPSDADGERPVGNALLLRRDSAYCTVR